MSANLPVIRDRWKQRESHLSSISARWNSNTHVPASVRAEAAKFFLGDSGPKYQYEAIDYSESYALTLEQAKARLDVISEALGDPSKPRKREESTMTYDGNTFVNLFHPLHPVTG